VCLRGRVGVANPQLYQDIPLMYSSIPISSLQIAKSYNGELIGYSIRDDSV